jgi:hypothetical protein
MDSFIVVFLIVKLGLVPFLVVLLGSNSILSKGGDFKQLYKQEIGV